MRSRYTTTRLLLGAILLVVMYAGRSAAEPAWHALSRAPVADYRLDDVWFLDERMGWTGLPGHVYRTVDGGSTWQAFAAPVRGVRCIAFATAANGWIGSVVDSIALWATSDSGATWWSVDLPAPKPRGLCGLSVVGTSVVYGCGAWYGTPTLVKSLDGGSSWKSIDLSSVATGLVDCHFFSPDSGFVVGSVGTAWVTDWREVILFTADGGETWETRYTGKHLESWCWKISFPSRRVGYVSVESANPQTPTHCLKTEDGGRTWNEVRLSETGSFFMQGIGFVTEQQGWAGGTGALQWTSDGGLIWEDAAWGTRINRFRFLGPKLGYAAGRTIYKFSDPDAVPPLSFTGIKRKWR